MIKFRVSIFYLLCIFCLIPRSQASESTCADSQGYSTCKKECTSPYCPPDLFICQRAYSKCKPKCFERHC